MTPKQTEKIRILRTKVLAGLPIRESEWPSWQRSNKAWEWKPSQETRGYAQFRGEYETAMRATHGQDWEPNPAAVEWAAYNALETGIRCNTCGRPGLEWCQSCRNWLERISDRKRIRRIVTPQVSAVA